MLKVARAAKATTVGIVGSLAAIPWPLFAEHILVAPVQTAENMPSWTALAGMLNGLAQAVAVRKGEPAANGMLDSEQYLSAYAEMLRQQMASKASSQERKHAKSRTAIHRWPGRLGLARSRQHSPSAERADHQTGREITEIVFVEKPRNEEEDSQKQTVAPKRAAAVFSRACRPKSASISGNPSTNCGSQNGQGSEPTPHPAQSQDQIGRAPAPDLVRGSGCAVRPAPHIVYHSARIPDEIWSDDQSGDCQSGPGGSPGTPRTMSSGLRHRSAGSPPQ